MLGVKTALDGKNTARERGEMVELVKVVEFVSAWFLIFYKNLFNELTRFNPFAQFMYLFPV